MKYHINLKAMKKRGQLLSSFAVTNRKRSYTRNEPSFDMLLKISEIFPSSTTVESNQDRIYISENLTSYRRSIMKEANQRKRNKSLASVWTLDGKIYVKTSPDGERIRIFSGMGRPGKYLTSIPTVLKVRVGQIKVLFLL